MMTTTERETWLCLAFMPFVGAERFNHLLNHFGNAQRAWQASAEEVSTILMHKPAIHAWRERRSEAEQAAQAALQWEQQENCHLLLSCDNHFPSMLTEGITPPPVLFVRGKKELLHYPAVAIVGSRHATPQAISIAREFAHALAEQEIVVVSGMATGIDTAAHQGALQANGLTVSVWGTGINRIYPAHNQQLAYELAERSVIISEFPLNTRPLASHFPRRNRLIAALAQVTLVIEAALESGSLITAHLAAEMGREVMAIPSSIHNPQGKGCHKLIKEGAKLVECIEDIMQECPQLLQKPSLSSYAIKNKATSVASVLPSIESSEFAHTVLHAMGFAPIHPDSLAEQLNLPAADVYAALLEYELAGQITLMTGGRYQRVKS